MTTKLEVYNHALRLIGELPLTDLNQNVPNRHLLDNAWQTTIPDCLTQAPWNFALKKVELANIQENNVPTIKFEQPADWLSTAYAWVEPAEQPIVQETSSVHWQVEPLTAQANIRNYGGVFEVANGVANGETIDPDGTRHPFTAANKVTIEYISSDFEQDANVVKWTPQFAQFVAYALAVEINSTSTQNVDLQEMLKKELAERQQLAIARNQKDDPQKRNPIDPGSASRLSIYNQVLRRLGAEQLFTLNDNVAARYELDQAWERNVQKALVQGIWNFAVKQAVLTYQGEEADDIEYYYKFAKPDDWMFTNYLLVGGRIIDVGETTFATSPYRDIDGFIYLHEDEVFDPADDNADNEVRIEYGSTDANDPAHWSAEFSQYLALEIAMELQPSLAPDMSTGKVEMLRDDVRIKLNQGRTRDARNEPAVNPRPGRWLEAQRGGYSSNAYPGAFPGISPQGPRQ